MLPATSGTDGELQFWARYGNVDLFISRAFQNPSGTAELCGTKTRVNPYVDKFGSKLED